MYQHTDGECIEDIFIIRIILKLEGASLPSLLNFYGVYRGADKSLARPISRCILFDGENISFDASLVIYINSNNVPPIMIIIIIINRIYETQNLLSL
jgi:hypothetical protein